MPASVHVGLENEPWPPADQLTVPVGVIAVPAPVSVTVAVHVAGAPTTTEPSHCTDVEVGRSVAVTVVDDAPSRCEGSPP